MHSSNLAPRGQHSKGKQNKNQNEIARAPSFYIYRIEKALSCLKKWLVIGTCHTYPYEVMKLVHELYTHFQWQSLYSTTLKKRFSFKLSLMDQVLYSQHFIFFATYESAQ